MRVTAAYAGGVRRDHYRTWPGLGAGKILALDDCATHRPAPVYSCGNTARRLVLRRLMSGTRMPPPRATQTVSICVLLPFMDSQPTPIEPESLASLHEQDARALRVLLLDLVDEGASVQP